MANDYYVPAGVPANNAALSSSAVRGELGSVEDGFEKLPAITGNNSKIVRVNAGATALETVATVPHEQGGVEADISAIADGGILVGTGTGTMGIRASALTGGASGFLKHEIGGIEANISAIADGGILVGTGTGTMAVRASALTGGASGFLKHEVGGLEFDASGVVDGDFLVGTGTGTIGLESGSTARTSLGLGTMATQAASSVSITGGSISGITDLTVTDGGTGVSAMPSFSVKRTTDQAIAASTDVKVQWDSEVIDSNSNFDSTTNYRFTPTVAGTYFLHAQGIIMNIAVNETSAISINKNGATAHQFTRTTSSSETSPTIQVSALVSANGTTDYFEVYVRHGDSVSRDLFGASEGTVTYFQGFRAGP